MQEPSQRLIFLKIPISHFSLWLKKHWRHLLCRRGIFY